MPKPRVRPSWHLPEAAATPEAVVLDRRTFVRAAAGALLLPSLGCGEDGGGPWQGVAKYPRAVERNEAYDPGRAVTNDVHAASFNNFYEFSLTKNLWKEAQALTVDPWTVEIVGAKKAGKHDVDDLLKKLPQEERVYRFRCVETWAMTVPWIGIPMKKFVEWAEPPAKAKYVRFVTFHRPKEAPNQNPGRPFSGSFPYYEGLRLDEATNELTLLATGMYGRRLPKQNGAPIRLIVPWKYGFKSCKSIVRIEFTETRPKTFWNDAAGNEYGFYANVNPEVAHPRWSQAKEWLLPTQDERIPTSKFNGYGEQAAALYKGMDLARNY